MPKTATFFGIMVDNLTISLQPVLRFTHPVIVFERQYRIRGRQMTARWHDARVPSGETCTLAAQLDRWAEIDPDKILVAFADGTRWSYAETLDLVKQTAEGLRRLGVRKGDLVNVWLPNGPDIVRVWFAINYVGAVYAPLNIHYRGAILEHVLRQGAGRFIIVHAEFVPLLRRVAHARLTDAVIVGGPVEPVGELNVHGEQALAPPMRLAAREAVDPWDLQMVIYTSGTTGPSKGVEVTYFQNYTSIVAIYGHLTRDDRCLCATPLFHVSGVSGPLIAIERGASFTIVEGFSASQFWDLVRQTESTSAVLLGVMATFLASQPESTEDRTHGLRYVTMVPLTEDSEAFSRRFGCDVYTAYNMTETSCPIAGGPNPQPIGTCGRITRGVEARLVDTKDCEVAVGELGELIVRTDAPWAMSPGYINDPAATAAAWRNGWFHTGDLFRRDAAGNYFFVDRLKDSIRRRGENISSFEVETEVCAHPAVREAAAVAVKSEVGEDELMIVVSKAPGEALDPEKLIDFLADRVPYFMVPRYIRLVSDLPKTPTHKVMKHVLREEGLAGDVFDAVAAGVAVKRQRPARTAAS